MDSLFQSYNANISLTSFESLSSCTINWLEQFCKPQVSPSPFLYAQLALSVTYMQILKEVLTQQLHIAQLTSQHLYQHSSSSLH